MRLVASQSWIGGKKYDREIISHDASRLEHLNSEWKELGNTGTHTHRHTHRQTDSEDEVSDLC